MRASTSLLALLTAAAVSFAGPVQKVDSPPKPDWQVIQCDPVLTVLQVEKPGTWELVDESPVAVLRQTGGDGKQSATAAFAGQPSQQYRVLVTTPDGVHRLKLVTPGPPQPLPPDPDKPKPPTPPPPVPVDPLVQRFQGAYEADGPASAIKKESLLDLVVLYKQATALPFRKAESLPNQKPEDVPFLYGTTLELVEKVQVAAKDLEIDGLLLLRKAIAAELKAVFPVNEPLTAESRAKAASIFGKIKTALEQVK